LDVKRNWETTLLSSLRVVIRDIRMENEEPVESIEALRRFDSSYY
jgi:hypothetical protein